MSIFSFLSNPIALAAATVAAIGVIVYQMMSQNEERAHGNTRDNRRPPSGPTSSSNSGRSFGNDVRRRKPNENTVKPSFSNNASQSTSVKTETKRSNFDEECYKQNVFNKMEEDVKNFNQRDENMKKFVKNIDVPNCHESDNSENMDETKVTNLNASHNVAHTQLDSCSNDTKKENSQQNMFRNSDLSLSASNVAGTSNQNITKSMCRACEEVHANAVSYPCNHCYLCENCATMVFRIYKKCTICDSEVERFQIFEN